MVPSEDTVLKALEARLQPPAVEHSRSTAETAGLLATIYGVDMAKARVAALLHDWDRDLTPSELVARASMAGADLTEAERRVPYLLHAATGAAGVRDAFPDIDAEIVSAIEGHTTGSVTMSDLDKVIYIADTIEPLRDFDGVDSLREAAGNVSLHDLFGLCYTRSLLNLIQSKRFIHPETVAVWNAQVAGGIR